VDKVVGLLEVGRTDDTHEIVIKYPYLKPDANGIGRIVFLPCRVPHQPDRAGSVRSLVYFSRTHFMKGKNNV
jgi:hypothetical protein